MPEPDAALHTPLRHCTVCSSPSRSAAATRISKSCTSALQREQRLKVAADDDSWHLPIGHRAEDSLEMEGLEMASASLPIPDHNKGFQMLQRMGWKGAGLGREEHGGSFFYDASHSVCGWGWGQYSEWIFIVQDDVVWPSCEYLMLCELHHGFELQQDRVELLQSRHCWGSHQHGPSTDNRRDAPEPPHALSQITFPTDLKRSSGSGSTETGYPADLHISTRLPPAGIMWVNSCAICTGSHASHCCITTHACLLLQASQSLCRAAWRPGCVWGWARPSRTPSIQMQTILCGASWRWRSKQTRTRHELPAVR